MMALVIRRQPQSKKTRFKRKLGNSFEVEHHQELAEGLPVSQEPEEQSCQHFKALSVTSPLQLQATHGVWSSHTRSFSLNADDDSVPWLLTHSLTHSLCKTLNHLSTSTCIVSLAARRKDNVTIISRRVTKPVGIICFKLPCQLLLHPVIP